VVAAQLLVVGKHVRQAGRVRHHVPHEDRLLTAIAKRGEYLARLLVEANLAAFDQQHRRRYRHGLAHGRCKEDGVGIYRIVAIEVLARYAVRTHRLFATCD